LRRFRSAKDGAAVCLLRRVSACDLSLTKPFLWRHEATLKQNGAYPSIVHPGEAVVTIVVAFLVCCSGAVFLAHAFDAYTAR
jgi:hypothetical protein